LGTAAQCRREAKGSGFAALSAGEEPKVRVSLRKGSDRAAELAAIAGAAGVTDKTLKKKFTSVTECAPAPASGSITSSRPGLFISSLVSVTVHRDHIVQELCESRLRWTSWAVRPNEPSGFRGRKELLNRALALVTICP